MDVMREACSPPLSAPGHPTLSVDATASANRKLTTVLADLVASSGSTTALTTESQRPRSVRDSIQSRRLRIDANNEVQVYILMSAVTDETVSQLTNSGVTI
jgi:hypothetical protein